MTTIARPGTPFPHVADLAHSSASYSYFAMPSPVASSSSSTSRRYSQPLHFTLQSIPSRTPPSLLKRSASSSSSSSTSIAASAPKHRRSLSPIPSPVLESPSVGLSEASSSTPPLISRRESASSSCTLSPPMPATPVTHAQPLAPSPAHAHAKAHPARPMLHKGLSAFPEFDDFRLGAPLGTPSEGVIEILEDDAYDLARSQAEAFYRKPATPPSTPAPAPALALARQFDPSFYPPRGYPSVARSKRQVASDMHRPALKRRDTPRPVETFTSLALSSLGSWYSAATRGGAVDAIEEVDERLSSGRQAVRRYTSVVDGGEWMVLA